MKGGHVIGAPSKGPNSIRKAGGNKPSTANRYPSTNSSSAGKADEHIALALHRIVVANLPNQTLVEDINNLYQQMFRRNFPKISNFGIANGLKSNYDHILKFSSVGDKLYCGPVNPPGIGTEELLEVHRNARSGSKNQSAPTASTSTTVTSMASKASVVPSTTVPTTVPAPIVPQPPVVPVLSRAQMNEQTFSYLAQGVRTVLSSDPSVGEAANIDELRAKISKSFFDVFRIPIALEAGKVLVDPIAILQKNEGTLFTKLVEEPVTGRVSVKPIVAQKIASMSPVGTSEYETFVVERMKRLRTSLVRNLELIDSVISRSLPLAQPGIFQDAMETLVDHQVKTSMSLQGFFPATKSTT